jgi:hypothetical protein
LANEGGVESGTVLLDALSGINGLSESQIDALALAYGKSGDKTITDKFVFILNWWFDTLIFMCVNNESRRHIGTIDLKIPEGQGLHRLLRLKEEIDSHIQTCLNGSLDKRYMIYKALRLLQND